MITLHQLPPLAGKFSLSPFCLKVEAYLRLAAIEYETVIEVNPSKGPKGQLPFVEHGDSRIGDSSFIIDYLKQTFGPRVKEPPTDAQKALALSLKRLLENHLYWAIVHARWGDERMWPKLKDALFSDLPLPLKMLVPDMVRGRVIKALKAQGMGRHLTPEIYSMAEEDLQAVSVLLGDKDWFLGDEPLEIDAIAFAFLAQLTLKPHSGTPLSEHALEYKNLVNFVDRFAQRYFPD